VGAAREILVSMGFAGFTVDAVARRAGVARMTVYYQFGSKRELIEALFDDLAARGLVDRLRATFDRPEPFDALAEFIGAFVGFWASERVVMRRLNSLGGLDPDVEQGVHAREERRVEGLRVIVGRVAEKYDRPTPRSLEEAIDVLRTLTSFETFDTLAGPTRNPEEVATLLIRLAHSWLGIDRA